MRKVITHTQTQYFYYLPFQKCLIFWSQCMAASVKICIEKGKKKTTVISSWVKCTWEFLLVAHTHITQGKPEILLWLQLYSYIRIIYFKILLVEWWPSSLDTTWQLISKCIFLDLISDPLNECLHFNNILINFYILFQRTY